MQVGAVSAAKNPWWRQHEVRRLLETVRKILPLGELQWQEVSSAYNTGRPEGCVERNTDSCKTKFKALKNAKKSTGIAEIPWDIAESKDIQKAIESKMCAAELDDDASLREGDGAFIDQEQDGSDGESESESEQGTGDSQPHNFSPTAQAGSDVTARRPSASNSASPHDKPPSDVPARLGIIEAQKGVVANTATAKRLKLDKQIADNQHQRNAQAEHRNVLLASMLQQQHQSNQIMMQQMQSQSQQSQQMQMMLMMMMIKMTGVQMPAMPAFAPPSQPPHDVPHYNERE